MHNLHAQALALNETHLGLHHSTTVTSVVDLSRVMQLRGKLAEALAFSRSNCQQRAFHTITPPHRLELSRRDHLVVDIEHMVHCAVLLADQGLVLTRLGMHDRTVEVLFN